MVQFNVKLSFQCWYRSMTCTLLNSKGNLRPSMSQKQKHLCDTWVIDWAPFRLINKVSSEYNTLSRCWKFCTIFVTQSLSFNNSLDWTWPRQSSFAAVSLGLDSKVPFCCIFLTKNDVVYLEFLYQVISVFAVSCVDQGIINIDDYNQFFHSWKGNGPNLKDEGHIYSNTLVGTWRSTLSFDASYVRIRLNKEQTVILYWNHMINTHRRLCLYVSLHG